MLENIFSLQQLSLSLSHWDTILSNQLHPAIIFRSQRCAASNTFNFFRRNLKNSAKISGNVFSYTIGGLKASEKENSVLCLYCIGEAAPRPEIRERAKVQENISWTVLTFMLQARRRSTLFLTVIWTSKRRWWADQLRKRTTTANIWCGGCLDRAVIVNLTSALCKSSMRICRERIFVSEQKII